MALASRRIKQFELNPDDLDRKVAEAMGGISEADYVTALVESVNDVKPGSIVQALVDSVDEATGLVVMDIGGKSEGAIPLVEFGELLPTPGSTFEVFYEGLDENDTAVISKRRADRLRAWERVSAKYNEGDEIQGVVQRKIKGGLLVDVEGVNVFLPASQVNLRRTHDINDFVNEPIRARIIKIDSDRQNIVISRRKLLEEERQKQKELLLDHIAEGELRVGTVKNIADFGVFVDLGGIDGLLHITDMTWGRISHPSAMVEMDQEIEVKVLKVDRDRERIALGLKQKSASPWEGIEDRYPIDAKQTGEVVNIMTYGAFVKLEEGVEGLVHISEMSWTRRVNHPHEMVKVGDMVNVVVLDLNKEKQEISLGMKQAEANPWDLVEEHYPTGTVIEGTVRNLTSYGAFVEIEEGIDGLLHITDMSWTKKITHPSEMVKKGDKVQCVILTVDTQRKRIALGSKQLQADPWQDEIPSKFHVGDLLSGHVTKITNFGAFVRLEDELEGLLHVSELSDHKITSPEEVVSPGMKVEVRVIRVDTEERKIGLSFVHADFEENLGAKAAAEAAAQAATETAAAPAEAPASEATEASAEATEAPAEATEAPAETAETPTEAVEAVETDSSETPAAEGASSEDEPKKDGTDAAGGDEPAS